MHKKSVMNLKKTGLQHNITSVDYNEHYQVLLGIMP
jgi:hypothetical protein